MVEMKMPTRLGHAFTIGVVALAGVVLAGASALANGADPIDVAEPMSIAAFVSGVVALYAVRKRRNGK